MTGDRWTRACLGATLLTLPWIGLGTVRLLTGHDLGAGVQPSWLFLAAATAGLWRRRADRPPPLPRPAALLAGAAAAALGLSAAGLWVAPAPVPPGEAWLRYGKQVAQLAIMAAFLAWPAWWVRGAARWRWTARLVVAGALLQAAYGLLQGIQWAAPGPLLPVLERVFTSNPAILSGSEQLHLADGFRDVPRLRGTACEPLYLGSFLLLALPLVALTGWGPRRRAAAAAALALLLVMTWSRGAWLAAAGGVAVAVVLGRLVPATGPRGLGRRRGWLGAAAAVGLLAAAIAALDPGLLALPLERLAQSFSQRDWSNLTRLYSMQAAWRAFLLSPLCGVGWGQFPWHFPLLVDAPGLQSQFQWPVVNNFPLQILCETGLAGFGVFAAAAATLARATVRGLRRAGPAGALRLRVAAVATAAVWLQLLTFSQYNLPHLWVAPGLLLAALADRTDGAEGTP